MLTFKVTMVGASEGFILNKEAKLRLNVQKGDTLHLTGAPDGAHHTIRLGFARQMTLAESILHDDRKILRVLAQ